MSLVITSNVYGKCNKDGHYSGQLAFSGDKVVLFKYANTHFEPFLIAVRPILEQHGVLNTLSVALLPTSGQTMGNQAMLMEVKEKARAQSLVQVVPR